MDEEHRTGGFQELKSSTGSMTLVTTGSAGPAELRRHCWKRLWRSWFMGLINTHRCGYTDSGEQNTGLWGISTLILVVSLLWDMEVKSCSGLRRAERTTRVCSHLLKQGDLELGSQALIKKKNIKYCTIFTLILVAASSVCGYWKSRFNFTWALAELLI